MADLPLEGRTTQVNEKKEVKLSAEERLDLLGKDILELARGVNAQGALLESIVVAFDHVVKKYMGLVRQSEAKEETK